MKKFILILSCVLLFSSCAKKGIDVSPSGQADNYEVQKLFTIEGVTIYRFKDSGYHYFILNGKMINTVQSQSTKTGKTTTTTYWDDSAISIDKKDGE